MEAPATLRSTILSPPWRLAWTSPSPWAARGMLCHARRRQTSTPQAQHDPSCATMVNTDASCLIARPTCARSSIQKRRSPAAATARALIACCRRTHATTRTATSRRAISAITTSWCLLGGLCACSLPSATASCTNESVDPCQRMLRSLMSCSDSMVTPIWSVERAGGSWGGRAGAGWNQTS